MNANKILKTLEEARLASKGERVEFTLINPSDRTLDLIKENGGRVESKQWVQWCHSDTCAHNSHDAGEERVLVAVTPNWIPNGSYPDANKLFEGVENEKLLLVVPTETMVVGIFERSHGRHFAPSTVACDAKFQE